MSKSTIGKHLVDCFRWCKVRAQKSSTPKHRNEKERERNKGNLKGKGEERKWNGNGKQRDGKGRGVETKSPPTTHSRGTYSLI